LALRILQHKRYILTGAMLASAMEALIKDSVY